MLGLTATPNRSDNVDILQFLGNNLLYKKDLIDGINADLLCNFEYHGINDKHVDLCLAVFDVFAIEGDKVSGFQVSEGKVSRCEMRDAR